MSADKKRLHNRAKEILKQVKKLTAFEDLVGLHYCWDGGIGPCKELDYLLKKGCVRIYRPTIYYKFSNRRISQIIFVKDL